MCLSLSSHSLSLRAEPSVQCAWSRTAPPPGGGQPWSAGFLPRRAHRTNQAQAGAAPLAGPGSDGVLVTWKDNFDSFYSEVAELGRYGPSPFRASRGRTQLPVAVDSAGKQRVCHWELSASHLQSSLWSPFSTERWKQQDVFRF